MAALLPEYRQGRLADAGAHGDLAALRHVRAQMDMLQQEHLERGQELARVRAELLRAEGYRETMRTQEQFILKLERLLEDSLDDVEEERRLEIEPLLAENQELRARCARLPPPSALAESEAKRLDLEVKFLDLENRRALAERQLALARQELSDNSKRHHEELTGKTVEIAQQSTRIRDLELRFGQSQTASALNAEEATKSKHDVLKKDAEIAGMHARMRELESQLMQEQTRARKYKYKVDELESQLSKAQVKLRRHSSELASAETEKGHMQFRMAHEIEAKDARIKDLESTRDAQIKDLESQLFTAATGIHRSRRYSAELANSQAEIAKRDAQIKDLEFQLDQPQSSKSPSRRYSAEIAESSAELGKLRNSVSRWKLLALTRAGRIRELEDQVEQSQVAPKKDKKGSKKTPQASTSTGDSLLKHMLEMQSSPELLEQLNEIKRIHQKGYVEINYSNGQVVMKKKVEYVTRQPDEEPEATFVDEEVATEVLEDVAAIWRVYPVSTTVEGHTKDIKRGTAEFWEALASNRAALCASRLVELGVQADLLRSVGLPGEGPGRLNEAALVIKLDILPDVE